MVGYRKAESSKSKAAPTDFSQLSSTTSEIKLQSSCDNFTNLNPSSKHVVGVQVNGTEFPNVGKFERYV